MSLPRSVRRWIGEKKTAVAYSRQPAVRAARDLNTAARLAQATTSRDLGTTEVVRRPDV